MATRPQKAARKRLIDQVECLVAGPYGKKIKDIEIQLWEANGHWHGSEWCAGENWRPGLPSPTKKLLALRNIEKLDENLCPDGCVQEDILSGVPSYLRQRRRQLRGAPKSPQDWFDEALDYQEWSQKTAHAERPPKSETADRVERRRAAAERIITAAQERVQARDLAAPQYEELRRRAEKVLEEVAKTTRGSEHQAKILTWVRRELLPTQLKHLDPNEFALDETPTLVGITPYLPSKHNQKVRALVEAFAVRAGDHNAVLVVPRYAYDYLQRNEMGRLHGPVLLQGVPAPRDEVAETAAGLWDPEGTANLASLADAVNAAEILEG